MNGYKIVLLKAIFMLYRLPESERVCSGICRTINMDSKGTVYLSKTMSIELGILGGGRVNFAHDEDTGEWYICHTTDKDGFTVWKDKRCARFSAGFIVRRIMLQAKVERKTVQFMIAKAPIEVGGTVYYKILLSNPIFK